MLVLFNSFKGTLGLFTLVGLAALPLTGVASLSWLRTVSDYRTALAVSSLLNIGFVLSLGLLF